MIDQIPKEEMSIQKLGIRNGLFSGILSIIYTLILYIIGGELLFKSSMQLIGYVILVVIMIVTVQMYRKEHGNYVSFRTAFGGAFSVSVLGVLLPVVFSYVLYNFIDPDLVVRLKEYSIQQSIEMMQWMNAPEETIDQTIDKLKEEDYTPTLGRMALGYAVALAFSALFAVFVALVFWLISRKYEPMPVFDNTPTDPTVLDHNP